MNVNKQYMWIFLAVYLLILLIYLLTYLLIYASNQKFFINPSQIGMHWRDIMVRSFESDWDEFQFKDTNLEENYV